MATQSVSPKVYVVFTALVAASQYDHKYTVRLELEFPNAYMGVVPLTQMASDTMAQAISDYGKRLSEPDPDAKAAPGSDEEFNAYTEAMIASTGVK